MERKDVVVDQELGQALEHLGHAEADLKEAKAARKAAEAAEEAAEGAEEEAEKEIHEALREIKEAEKHHEDRSFEIIVNGRKKVVTKDELSFDEIVALAFDQMPTGGNILFTITFRHGPHENPEGTLMEGATVKIKWGMIFNATATDKS